MLAKKKKKKNLAAMLGRAHQATRPSTCSCYRFNVAILELYTDLISYQAAQQANLLPRRLLSGVALKMPVRSDVLLLLDCCASGLANTGDGHDKQNSLELAHSMTTPT